MIDSKPRYTFKPRYMALALVAALASCGGGSDTAPTGSTAASATVLAASTSSNGLALGRTKTLSVFSNRQKIGEIDVPELAASADRSTGAELKRQLVSGDLVGDASRIDAGKSLMITALGTVNDPARTFDPSRPQQGTKGGVWSFGQLMRGLANSKKNGADESDFARAWITSFLAEGEAVRGETMAPRPAMAAILADWEKRSGVAPGGKLDLDMAPFRLLAIVNRIDLRDPSKPGDAGEARFVFGAIDADGNPLQFTVIFEFGVQLHPSHQALQDWAQQWVDLGKYRLPEQQSQYNAALQAITDQFTSAAKGAATANQNPLNQLRTNEALNRAPWELREFVLDRSTGLFKPTTVKKTPQFKFQNSEVLASFIRENYPSIMGDGDYEVPEFYKGQAFGTALAPTPTGATALGWNAPNTELNARRAFSLNTCSGCHHKETNPAGTFFFTHVRPRSSDTASVLSVFLTGKDASGNPATATDPVSNTAVYYNDLERRAIYLDAVVTNPVSSLPGQKRLKMVH